MSNKNVNQDVLEAIAVFTTEPPTRVEQILSGGVNSTYKVAVASQVFILQRINESLPSSVMENTEALQRILADSEIIIPRSIRTLSGDMVYQKGAGWWRALTFIEGSTVESEPTEKMAKSAGSLVARFHQETADKKLPRTKSIPHFHDTAYYLKKLEDKIKTCSEDKKVASIRPLAARIQFEARTLPEILNTLPSRIIHGDLKLTNFLFEDERATALIDLDTLMIGDVAIELGDALRSWCAVSEDTITEQGFNHMIASAFLAGYVEVNGSLTKEEKAAIPFGIEKIIIELAARFAIDAIEEKYFVLSEPYVHLFDQNMAKCQAQLALLDAFRKCPYLEIT